MIVYYTTENIEGSDGDKEKLYVSDGKTIQRLKGLKSFSNGQTELECGWIKTDCA